MPRYTLILCVITTTVLNVIADDDPCKTAMILEGEVWRSSANNVSSSSPKCDVTLKEGWYRINSEAGNDTVTECPPLNSCGTTYPIWMNGTIPEEANGVVQRTMCIVTIPGCCEHSLTIQVKNCSEYRVYKLVQTNGCPQAYCFGTIFVPLPTTTTSTTTTTTSTKPSPTTTLPHVADRDAIPDLTGGTAASVVLGIIIVIVVGVIVALVIKKHIQPGRPDRCNIENLHRRERHNSSTPFYDEKQ